jgi:hypothetical protein
MYRVNAAATPKRHVGQIGKVEADAVANWEV